jgi:uncharacterized protein (TIGR00661 family)
MKILYAIQGTGNGHLARAIDIYPILSQYGKVDVLVSGIQGDINLPFSVKYKLYGLSFIFGKNGGVDVWKTMRKIKLFRLISDIIKVPVSDYDLVINDFELVTAWACKIRKVVCISLSHQNAVLHPKSPKPEKNDLFGALVLKYYAPTKHKFGFHFTALEDHIFTPIIRKQIRNLKLSNQGHYTVYLPAYDDKHLIKVLSLLKNVKWQVFSKHNTEALEYKNISILPIENEAFLNSLSNCSGVLCGGGFETPAEVLFLGKKLMVIPMKGQYEQQCNALFLETLGIPAIDELCKKNLQKIAHWIDYFEPLKFDYPENTESSIKKVMNYYESLKN